MLVFGGALESLMVLFLLNKELRGYRSGLNTCQIKGWQIIVEHANTDLNSRLCNVSIQMNAMEQIEIVVPMFGSLGSNQSPS